MKKDTDQIIARTNGTLYAGFGTSATFAGFEQAADDGKPLVLGIGFAAENYPGGNATGTAIAHFSSLVVTTTAATSCFTTGLD